MELFAVSFATDKAFVIVSEKSVRQSGGIMLKPGSNSAQI